MYEFYLDDNKHSIKTSWEELSSDEFIAVSGLLTRFRKGDLTLFELRVHIVMLLLGLNTRRLKIKNIEDRLHENIYHLTREVHFYFRIEYENKKSFSALSKNIQQLLTKTFPEDLPETPEVRAAIKLKKHIRLDIEFGKNILKELHHGRQKYPGYTFELLDGVAQTSLTAQQFSEAQKIVSQFSLNESSRLLDLLCGILYQVGTYSEVLARDRSMVFASLPRQVKEAVLLNFCAVTNFIVHQTKYVILFDRPKKSKKAGKYSLGLADNMYMLSKRGYGDSRQMENCNLFKFFDLLLKEISDQAAELEAMGKKKAEIAEKMNLTITQLNEILS